MVSRRRASLAFISASWLLSQCSDPGATPSENDPGEGGRTNAAAGMPAAGEVAAGGGGRGDAGSASSAGGATALGSGGSASGGKANSEIAGAPASAGSSPIGHGGAGAGGAPAAGGHAAGARPGGAPSVSGAAGSAPIIGGAGGSGGSGIATTIPSATNGKGEIRNGTTLLKNARNGGKDVWDFGNQRIGVNNTIDCDDGEGQLTVFEVEDGVTVRNLIVAGGLPGGNGIVCKGNCKLEYVYWEDVCEDAATNSKDGATMILDHVIALHATDKVFQHNAKAGSKTVIQNSYVADFGKLWRSCGDCTANGGPRHLVLENVRIDQVKTAVAGANQNYGDTVTITNLFVKGGYDAAKDDPKICTEYVGVTDHAGESTKVDDGNSQWGTATCRVDESDVKAW